MFPFTGISRTGKFRDKKQISGTQRRGRKEWEIPACRDVQPFGVSGPDWKKS